MSEQKAPERIYAATADLGPEEWTTCGIRRENSDEVEYTRSDIATSHKEEAERYRILFDKYGWHVGQCQYEDGEPCTCGYAEALAGKQKEGT